MSSLGIGIDTSNYTTSVTILDTESLEVIENYQQLLKVKQGDKGLRQSEAFYQHVQNLGGYLGTLSHDLLSACQYISVSTRPRNVEGSYMPVFNAGLNFAKTLGTALGIPIIETDHQSGHLSAALYSHPNKRPKKFIGIHLSGGTTELLSCIGEKDHKDLYHFNCQVLGGTLDISAGQLIDRLGVALGIDFPCGAKMEETIGDFKVTRALQKLFPRIQNRLAFNLSGAENKSLALYEQEMPKEAVIAGTFDYIARQLVASIKEISELETYEGLVLFGGVAANTQITEAIKDAFDIPLIRGEKRFCTDNALGVAFLPLL